MGTFFLGVFLHERGHGDENVGFEFEGGGRLIFAPQELIDVDGRVSPFEIGHSMETITEGGLLLAPRGIFFFNENIVIRKLLGESFFHHIELFIINPPSKTKFKNSFSFSICLLQYFEGIKSLV